MKDNKAPLT